MVNRNKKGKPLYTPHRSKREIYAAPKPKFLSLTYEGYIKK